MKNIIVETDKILQINPIKNTFDAGEIIKFNGTVLPNKSLQLILENHLGEELAAENLEIGNTGFMQFEYQTTENDDKEGTMDINCNSR